MTETLTAALATFMVNRSKGIRGSNTLFAGGVDQVNTVKVRASQGFKPLDKDTYRLVVVGDPDQVPQQIRPYVELITGQPYRTGSAFYELTKPVVRLAWRTGRTTGSSTRGTRRATGTSAPRAGTWTWVSSSSPGTRRPTF